MFVSSVKTNDQSDALRSPNLQPAPVNRWSEKDIPFQFPASKGTATRSPGLNPVGAIPTTGTSLVQSMYAVPFTPQPVTAHEDMFGQNKPRYSGDPFADIAVPSHPRGSQMVNQSHLTTMQPRTSPNEHIILQQQFMNMQVNALQQIPLSHSWSAGFQPQQSKPISRYNTSPSIPFSRKDDMQPVRSSPGLFDDIFDASLTKPATFPKSVESSRSGNGWDAFNVLG